MNTNNNMPLPLWFIHNNSAMYFNLTDLVMRYQIDHIVYGYPMGNHTITSKIDKFVSSLKFSLPETIIYTPIDEHYSSVQASDMSWDFWKKHIWQDVMSAMVILEQWGRQ